MSWQLCPKCTGTGETAPDHHTGPFSVYTLCNLCRGKKILDITTGKPPED